MLKILDDIKRINDALFPPRHQPDPDQPRIDAAYLRELLPKGNLMSNTVTFTLSAPIEHNGTTISELTFSEATAGDLAAADAVSGEMTKTLAIFAGMSGVPLPALKKMKARDLGRLAEAVAPLMGESLEAAGSI